MSPVDPSLLEAGKWIAQLAGPFGAAWYGVKIKLNGQKEQLDRIEGKVDEVNGRSRRNERDVSVLMERTGGE